MSYKLTLSDSPIAFPPSAPRLLEDKLRLVSVLLTLSDSPEYNNDSKSINSIDSSPIVIHIVSMNHIII